MLPRVEIINRTIKQVTSFDRDPIAGIHSCCYLVYERFTGSELFPDLRHTLQPGCSGIRRWRWGGPGIAPISLWKVAVIAGTGLTEVHEISIPYSVVHVCAWRN